MNQIDLSRIFPQWEIEKLIGEGPYGTVFQAVRRDGEQAYRSAIKVISIPPDSDEYDFTSADELDRQAIRSYLKGIADDLTRNLSQAAHLSYYGVDSIVGIAEHHMVEKADTPGWDIYIRMAQLTPLTAYISDKALTEQEVIRLGCDICTALEVCGSGDLFHGDIKPENIFSDHRGTFKLGDFGIARIMTAHTVSPLPKSTVSYAAPEVVDGRGFDARSDVYSLGLLLYRLLNGNRLPFLSEKQLLSPSERQTALDRRLRGEKLPPPRDASEAMVHVILKACAFDPGARFANAAEFRQALLSVLSGTYTVPKKSRAEKKREPKNKTTSSPKERPRISTVVTVLLTVILTLLLVISGTMVFYLYQRRPVEVTIARVPSRCFTVGDHVETDGIMLLVEYADGTQKAVDSGFTVTPQILTEPGSQEVTVSYLWLKDVYTVSVDKKLVTLNVVSMPHKTTYEVGNVINTYGLSLEVIYSDGTSDTVTKGLSFSPLTLREEGTQEITVTYQNLSTTFNVEVLPEDDIHMLNPTLKCTTWVDGDGGLNENGEGVNWCLCIEFDLAQVPRMRWKEKITCSWTEVVNGDGTDKYAASFETAKEGMTYAVFEVIPAEESSTGNERFRMWLMLPDNPSIAGRQAVSAYVGAIKKTFSFELIYHGDYDTGTGWAVKNVEIQ